MSPIHQPTRDHYDDLLGELFSWSVGGVDAGIQRTRALFQQLSLTNPQGVALAVDLGAGSGCQSIPLAELGYQVLAIDFCQRLLDELNRYTTDAAIRTVCDDLLHFRNHLDTQPTLVCCMGDTLTHLDHQDEVRELITNVEQALAPGGLVIFTFRDYVSRPLTGRQRFIPVAADEDRVLTCVLEYSDQYVSVCDLLYQRIAGAWSFSNSIYRKLRLDPRHVRAMLTAQGFRIIHDTIDHGQVCLVARKIHHSHVPTQES